MERRIGYTIDADAIKENYSQEVNRIVSTVVKYLTNQDVTIKQKLIYIEHGTPSVIYSFDITDKVP